MSNLQWSPTFLARAYAEMIIVCVRVNCPIATDECRVIPISETQIYIYISLNSRNTERNTLANAFTHTNSYLYACGINDANQKQL